MKWYYFYWKFNYSRCIQWYIFSDIHPYCNNKNDRYWLLKALWDLSLNCWSTFVQTVAPQWEMFFGSSEENQCRISKAYRTMPDIFCQCIKLPVLNATSDMIFVFMSNKYACCAMACTSLALKLHALMRFRSCLPLRVMNKSHWAMASMLQ